MTATIPSYPAARPPELADRALLQERLSILQPVVSELCFANLLLFRHVHRYTISMLNNSLIIFGCGYDGIPYFLPPLSGERGETACRLLDEGRLLFGADEQFIERYLAGRDYLITPDRDNDDYLYLRRELAALTGSRFHAKKNRINHFAAQQDYRVEPYSANHQAAALKLLERWQAGHDDNSSRSFEAEVAANREGLLNASSVGLTGVVVLTDQGVAGFALGSWLNNMTAVCLFEKADPGLEGAAQLVNREFSRYQPVEMLYINRQQDLGHAGLRRAKSSYHPVRMVRKFKVARAS